MAAPAEGFRAGRSGRITSKVGRGATDILVTNVGRDTSTRHLNRSERESPCTVLMERRVERVGTIWYRRRGRRGTKHGERDQGRGHHS